MEHLYQGCFLGVLLDVGWIPRRLIEALLLSFFGGDGVSGEFRYSYVVCLFLGFARIDGIFGCFAVMSGCMIGYGLLGSYINMGVCLLFVMWHFGWERCVRVMTWGDYPSFYSFVFTCSLVFLD